MEVRSHKVAGTSEPSSSHNVLLYVCTTLDETDWDGFAQAKWEKIFTQHHKTGAPSLSTVPAEKSEETSSKQHQKPTSAAEEAGVSESTETYQNADKQSALVTSEAHILAFTRHGIFTASDTGVAPTFAQSIIGSRAELKNAQPDADITDDPQRTPQQAEHNPGSLMKISDSVGIDLSLIRSFILEHYSQARQCRQHQSQQRHVFLLIGTHGEGDCFHWNGADCRRPDIMPHCSSQMKTAETGYCFPVADFVELLLKEKGRSPLDKSEPTLQSSLNDVAPNHADNDQIDSNAADDCRHFGSDYLQFDAIILDACMMAELWTSVHFAPCLTVCPADKSTPIGSGSSATNGHGVSTPKTPDERLESGGGGYLLACEGWMWAEDCDIEHSVVNSFSVSLLRNCYCYFNPEQTSPPTAEDSSSNVRTLQQLCCLIVDHYVEINADAGTPADASVLVPYPYSLLLLENLVTHGPTRDRVQQYQRHLQRHGGSIDEVVQPSRQDEKQNDNLYEINDSAEKKTERKEEAVIPAAATVTTPTGEEISLDVACYWPYIDVDEENGDDNQYAGNSPDDDVFTAGVYQLDIRHMLRHPHRNCSKAEKERLLRLLDLLLLYRRHNDDADSNEDNEDARSEERERSLQLSPNESYAIPLGGLSLQVKRPLKKSSIPKFKNSKLLRGQRQAFT